MQIKNMTEFRKSMKETLDHISENDETVIISRSGNKDVVMLSIDNFNSIQETLHLMSSPANHERLSKAVEDIRKRKNLLRKDLLV